MEYKNKRSIISPERKFLLSKPNAVYIITCYDAEYFCTTHEQGCWRGFFSLYLQVVHGIAFAKKNGLTYQVNFGNLIYRYSDERKFKGDRNFWNYYFEQPSIHEGSEKILNVRHENYPLCVWNRSFVRQLNKEAVSQIKLKGEIKLAVDTLQFAFKDINVLGVHIRKTDHFNEVKPAPVATYYKSVEKRIKNYDKLFVATDDESILQLFRERYADKIIFNSFARTTGQVPLHGNMGFEDRYQLGLEALLDCHTLSACKFAILSPSNLSYAALLINPELKYTIIESWSACLKRWKTNIAFLLDRWNIRKW
jgi:hypothetical protein